MIRLAAVGDLHVSGNSAGMLRLDLGELVGRAHLLLLAGDVTRTGYPEQTAVLAEDLKGLFMPVVAVLGNHDYNLDRQDQIQAVLTRTGVHVLEGEATVIHVCGVRVGIVGLKGFGDGFLGACGSEFGKPQMRAFAGHT